MAAITVRSLSDETHRALKVRAASHNRSTEAEVRAILDDAVRRESAPGLGTLLLRIGQEYGGVELDVTRDPTPARPLDLL